MISIITPTHKKTHLLDLTIKSVLCQTYSDFEWVVLDNSLDGYFSKYLEVFFKNNPHLVYRKDKIKVLHKVYDVPPSIGKLKNDCVYLTSCGENEFVLLLDHDDFIHTDLLSNIDNVNRRYPEAQFITGDKTMLNYSINDMLFYSYDFSEIKNNYSKYQNNLVKFFSGNLSIHIDDIVIDLGYCNDYMYRYYDNQHIFDQFSIRKLNNNNYDFNTINIHPRCVKKNILKQPFFKFCEFHQLSEDIAQISFLSLFCRGCYIKNTPYYMIEYYPCGNTSDCLTHELANIYTVMKTYIMNIYDSLFELNCGNGCGCEFLNKDELYDGEIEDFLQHKYKNTH